VQDEKTREEVLQKSREIITLSKKVIYSIHRKNIDKASLALIKKKIAKLPKQNDDTNMNNVAMQEYVEAITFYAFVTIGKIPTSKELNVGNTNYLLGLCDLTGELMRKAVNDAIDKDFESVLKTKEMVSAIYGFFLQLDLRNGELRKKSDSIKWNLKKVEDVVYDLHMKGMIEHGNSS
jgi:predicted translin family RNA/ssDNA-binding protein